MNISTGASISFAILSLGMLTWVKLAPVAPKTYSVSHTQQEWSSIVDSLNYVTNRYGRSTSTEESDAFRAFLFRHSQDLIKQINEQMMKDTVKPKSK